MTYSATNAAKELAAAHAVKLSDSQYKRFVEALAKGLAEAHNCGYRKAQADLCMKEQSFLLTILAMLHHDKEIDDENRRMAGVILSKLEHAWGVEDESEKSTLHLI
jgi:hypothetical protein